MACCMYTSFSFQLVFVYRAHYSYLISFTVANSNDLSTSDMILVGAGVSLVIMQKAPLAKVSPLIGCGPH